MKPSVRKLKNIRGRITGYAASVGEVRADGSTPKEATEKCERAAHNALARLDRGTLVSSWRGHSYIVSPTTEGWAYWIDTLSRLDYSVNCPPGAREDAQDRALNHLAQNLWNADVNDDEFLTGLPSGVVDDLKRWIRFQRNYTRHIEAGKTCTEAHQLAASV